MLANRNFGVFLFGSIICSLGCNCYGTAEKPRFTVAGVMSVRHSDSSEGLRAFNYDKGMQIAILCRLPEEVQSIGGVVKEVITDNNENLISAEEGYKIHVSELSTDKKSGIFQIQAEFPNTSIKFFKQISGT